MAVRVRLYGTLNLTQPGRLSRFDLAVAGPTRAGELLHRLGLSPDHVELVARNGESIQLDELVADGDLLEAFPLAGGG